MVHAGELNKQITIQRPTIAQDTYGQEIETWTTLATVWAKVQIGAGREFWAAQKINAELSGLITVRYRKDIKPQYRVLYGYSTYEITAVIIVDDAITLEVKEVV